MKKLTPRQKQIAELVAAELTNKEIARVTRLARKTVENHIGNAARRLPGDEFPRAKLRLWFFSLSSPGSGSV